MSSQEKFEKWKFDNLRTDSNNYYRDVSLGESAWQAAQADQAEYVKYLEVSLNGWKFIATTNAEYIEKYKVAIEQLQLDNTRTFNRVLNNLLRRIGII